ncbi:uncharacterized protein LOC111682010 [Lucilia cuprina]|uniref:uncharacterized protein LOC111682010 n=1 Tax=Lucilia cuprina TaxID=7375 RepID=UPI001F057678|nr:uncharacterized protein LOC111682010 [Lucilia cuprina]
MDELDLYDDLDEFQEQQEKKSKELQAVEDKYQESLKTIEELQEENKKLKKNIQRIELGFQSLLDTARNEIRRKDKEIERLRKEKDDICFRRKIPSKDAHTRENQQFVQESTTSVNNPFKSSRDNGTLINETASATITTTNYCKEDRNVETNKRHRVHDNAQEKHRDAREEHDNKYSHSSQKNPKTDHDHERKRSRENDRESHTRRDYNRNHSREHKDYDKTSSRYKSSKSSESPERSSRRFERSQSRERDRSRNYERHRSHDYKTKDKYLKTSSKSPTRKNVQHSRRDDRHHGEISKSTDSDKIHKHMDLGNQNSKDLKEKDVLKETSAEKNSTREKYTKQKSTVSSQIEKVNLQLPSNNKKNTEDNKAKNSKEINEQQKTEMKNTENLKSLPLNKKETEVKSKQDLNNTFESNKQQNETIQDISLSTNLPEPSKLCTPRKVALFNELFGPLSSESSKTAVSICKGTNSLLTNIKGILAKTSQTDILSSATTSPGDYTDISSGMITPKENTVDFVSSENTTPTNIKDNNDGDLVKTNIDNCFILTQNVDKEVKTIACVDLTELLDDDIENEVDLIEIPGLDLCSGSKAKNSTNNKTEKKNLSKNFENSTLTEVQVKESLNSNENDENRKILSVSEIPVCQDDTELEKVSSIRASDKLEIADSSEETIELVENVENEKVKSLAAVRKEEGTAMPPSIDKTAIKSADKKQMITAIESIDKLDDAAVVEQSTTESMLNNMQMESFDTKSNTEEIPQEITSEEQMKITTTAHSTTSATIAPGSNNQIKETDLAFETKMYKNSHKPKMTEVDTTELSGHDNFKAEQRQDSVDASILSDNMTEDHTSNANENSNSNLPVNSLNSEEGCSMETEIIVDETFDEIEIVEESDRDTKLSPLIEKDYQTDTTIAANLNEAEVVESLLSENLINNSDLNKTGQSKEENELVLNLTEELTQTESEIEEITKDLTANNNLKTDQTKISYNINENLCESKTNEEDENSMITCTDDISEAELLEKSMENFIKTNPNEEVPLISSALIENNNNECTKKVSDSHMYEERSNSLALREELKTILDPQAEVEQICTKTSAEEMENLMSIKESLVSTVLEGNNETAESDNEEMTENEINHSQIAQEKGVNAEETATSIVVLESNETIEVQKISLETLAIDSENDNPTLKPSDSTAFKPNRDQTLVEKKRLEETLETSAIDSEIDNPTFKSSDFTALESNKDQTLVEKKRLEETTANCKKDESEIDVSTPNLESTPKVLESCDFTASDASKYQVLAQKNPLEKTTANIGVSELQETAARCDKEESKNSPQVEISTKVSENEIQTTKSSDFTAFDPLEESTENIEVSELQETAASCEKEESRSSSQVEISAKVSENEIHTTKSSDFTAFDVSKDQAIAQNKPLEVPTTNIEVSELQETAASSQVEISAKVSENEIQATESSDFTTFDVSKDQAIAQNKPLEVPTTNIEVSELQETAASSQVEISAKVSENEIQTTESSRYTASDASKDQTIAQKNPLEETTTVFEVSELPETAVSSEKEESRNSSQVEISAKVSENEIQTTKSSDFTVENLRLEEDNDMSKTETHTEETTDDVAEDASEESEFNNSPTTESTTEKALDSEEKVNCNQTELSKTSIQVSINKIQSDILEREETSFETPLISSTISPLKMNKGADKEMQQVPHHEITLQESATLATTERNSKQTQQVIKEASVLGQSENSIVRESNDQIIKTAISSEAVALKSLTTSDYIAAVTNSIVRESNVAQKAKNFKKKNYVEAKPIQTMITRSLRKQLQDFFLQKDKHLMEFKTEKTALVLAKEKLDSTMYFKNGDVESYTKSSDLYKPHCRAKDSLEKADVVVENKKEVVFKSTAQVNDIFEFQIRETTNKGEKDNNANTGKDVILKTNSTLRSSDNQANSNQQIKLINKDHDKAVEMLERNENQQLNTSISSIEANPMEIIAKDKPTEQPIKEVNQDLETSEGPLTKKPRIEKNVSQQLEDTNLETSIGSAALQKQNAKRSLDLEIPSREERNKAIGETTKLLVNQQIEMSYKDLDKAFEPNENQQLNTSISSTEANPIQIIAKDKPTEQAIKEVNQELESSEGPLTKKAKIEKNVSQQLEDTNLETSIGSAALQKQNAKRSLDLEIPSREETNKAIGETTKLLVNQQMEMSYKDLDKAVEPNENQQLNTSISSTEANPMEIIAKDKPTEQPIKEVNQELETSEGPLTKKPRIEKNVSQQLEDTNLETSIGLAALQKYNAKSSLDLGFPNREETNKAIGEYIVPQKHNTFINSNLEVLSKEISIDSTVSEKQKTTENKEKTPVKSMENLIQPAASNTNTLIPETSEVSKQNNTDLETTKLPDPKTSDAPTTVKLIPETPQVSKQQNTDLEVSNQQQNLKFVEDLTQSSDLITNKLIHGTPEIPKQQNDDLESSKKVLTTTCEHKEKISLKSVEELTQSSAFITNKLIYGTSEIPKQQNDDLESSKKVLTTYCKHKEKISVKSIKDLTHSPAVITNKFINKTPEIPNADLVASNKKLTTTCEHKEKISVKSIEDLTQSAVQIRNKLLPAVPVASMQQSANNNTVIYVPAVSISNNLTPEISKISKQQSANRKTETLGNSINQNKHVNLEDTKKTGEKLLNLSTKHIVPVGSKMSAVIEHMSAATSHRMQKTLGDIEKTITSYECNVNMDPISSTSASRALQVEEVESIGNLVQRQIPKEKVANMSSVLTNTPESLVLTKSKHNINNDQISSTSAPRVQSLMKQQVEEVKGIETLTQRQLANEEVANVTSILANTSESSVLTKSVGDVGETECLIPKLSYFARPKVATPSNVFKKIITKEINIEGEIVEVVRIHIPKGSSAANEIRKLNKLSTEILSSPPSCSNKKQEIEGMSKKSIPICFQTPENKFKESTAINSGEMLNSPATSLSNQQEIQRIVKICNPTNFESPEIPRLESTVYMSCGNLNTAATFSCTKYQQNKILDSPANKDCDFLNTTATSLGKNQEIIKKTNPTSFETLQIPIMDSTANESCEYLNKPATSLSKSQEIVKKTKPTSFESPQIIILDSTANKSYDILNTIPTSSSKNQEIEKNAKKSTTPTRLVYQQIPLMDSTANKSCENLNTTTTSSITNQEELAKKSNPTNSEYQDNKILETTVNKSPLKESKTPRKETAITALIPKTQAYKHGQVKDSYTTISSILPETFSTLPVLPSISTTSPTPSNFSGLFSKKTSTNPNTDDDSIRTKKKSPLFINKPKEYIIPAASVLCNVDNLENATKANKKLHWELLENKNEMTEIEDDADVDTTDEEEPKIKEEPLEQASTSPKQASPQSKQSVMNLQKTLTSETDTQTEDESLLKELKRHNKHKKLKRKSSSKVHKSKHHKHKLPKTVKARLKAIAKRHEKDNLADSAPFVQQQPFTIILPKRPVGRPRKLQNCPKVEKIVQHKKRGRKPKQLVVKPHDVYIPKESLESSYKTKSNESFRTKKRNTKERNSPDVVNNLENTLRILSSSVERLEICDETCNSRDSSKQRKTFEKQMEESQYEDAFNTSMIYQKQDSSRESINISAIAYSSTEAQKQNKPESTNRSGSREAEEKRKTDLLSASIIKEPVIKLIEIPTTSSREAQEKRLIIARERKSEKVKSKKEKSLKSKTKMLMKKKLKSKMKNKVAPFISLEDIGIKVRPLKGHLSSFKIPKIKKDTEESIDDSWKLEAYEELEKEGDKEKDREAAEHEKDNRNIAKERSDNEKEDKDKQPSARPKTSKAHEINCVKETIQKAEKFPFEKETTQVPHNKSQSKDGSKTTGNYIIQFDNKTKTGKRKLFSPDLYDESEKAENLEIPEDKNSQQIYQEQCQYLSETHELNPVKFTRKSLIFSKTISDISQVSANLDNGETSSTNTSTKPCRKSINIHRRILDSSSEEDEVNTAGTNVVQKLSEEVAKTSKTSKTEAGNERSLKEEKQAVSSFIKETKKPLRGRRKSMYVESTAKETVVSEKSEIKKISQITRRKSMYIERTSPEAVESEDSETIKRNKQPARRKSMYAESVPIAAVETEEEIIKTSRRKSMYVESSGKEAVESEESETSKRIRPIRIKSMYVEETPLEPVVTEEETKTASKTNRRKSMYVESTTKEAVETEKSVTIKRNMPARRKSMYVERTQLEAFGADEQTNKVTETNKGEPLSIGTIPIESKQVTANKPIKAMRRKSLYIESPASVESENEGIEMNKSINATAEAKQVLEPQTTMDYSKFTEKCNDQQGKEPKCKEIKVNKPTKVMRRKSMYIESPSSLESDNGGIEANKSLKAGAETAPNSSKLTEKCNEEHGKESHVDKSIKATRRKSMYLESPAASFKDGTDTKLVQEPQTALDNSKLTENCSEQCDKESHPKEIKADRSIKPIRRKSVYIESPALLESETKGIETNKSIKAGSETKLVQEPQTDVDKSKLRENCNDQQCKELQPTKAIQSFKMRRKSMYADSKALNISKPQTENLIDKSSSSLNASKIEELIKDSKSIDPSKSLCEHSKETTKPITSFKMRRKSMYLERNSLRNEEIEKDSRDLKKSELVNKKKVEETMPDVKNKEETDIDSDAAIESSGMTTNTTNNSEEVDSLRKQQIAADSDSLTEQQKSNKMPLKSNNQRHNFAFNNEELLSEDELEKESESKRRKLNIGSDSISPDVLSQMKAIKMRRKSTNQRQTVDSFSPDRESKKVLEVSKKSKEDKEKISEDISLKIETPQTETVSETIKARRKSTNQPRNSTSSIEQKAKKDSIKTMEIKPEETKKPEDIGTNLESSQQMDTEGKSLVVAMPVKSIKMRRKSTIERVNPETAESTKSITSKPVNKTEEEISETENNKKTETSSSSSMKMRRKSTNQIQTKESTSKEKIQSTEPNKDVDSDSSLVLTPHKSIKIRRKSINQLRVLDSSSDDNEPLIKKPTVIESELKTPLTTAPKSRSRKKRIVKVLSSSMESPVTNTTNSSQLSSGQTSPLTSPNHPIFDTEVPTQCTEFAAMTPNQQDDNKFREIDSKLHEIFQSPQYTVDYRISAAVDSSNLTILPPPDAVSSLNEISVCNSVINQSSVNMTQLNDSNSTLNDTTAIQSGSEVKHISLGAADYRFEKVSDNVINLFISRKRKRKRNN